MPKRQNSIFAEIRRQEISSLIQKNGEVSVNALCDKFSVSPATIRTDLNEMASAGSIKRTHGGAILLGRAGYELTTSEKRAKNIGAKRAIAKEALRYIHQGDAIGIDTGTTAMELAKLLVPFQNLTVVTNDIEIALMLEQTSNINIMLLGGIVRKKFHCTVGNTVVDELGKIHIDTLFLATNGISIERGLSTPNVDVASIKRKMIEDSGRVVLMADKSKFQNDSFSYFASLSDLDVIISDGEFSAKLKGALGTEKIEFVHVESGCPSEPGEVPEKEE